MNIARRRFLRLTAWAALSPALSAPAIAQNYPLRPIKWVVSFPAGGPGDIVARLMANVLSEELGQPFIVENRPGASGNVGTNDVVRAPPDGYTLLLVVTNAAINASLYPKLNFNFLQDIAPVAGLLRAPEVMIVNPSVPANSVSEFIAYAKANPGKLNMATAGNGSPQHVAGELFSMMAGVDLVTVPYKGSAPALRDLIAGQVQVMFDVMVSAIGFIKAGKLRPLAVTTATRSPVLPDVPAVGEFVHGYEASGWQGIGAPQRTPREVIDKLNGAINTALNRQDVSSRFAELGAAPMPMTPSQFGKFVADETEKWARVVKFANIKAG